MTHQVRTPTLRRLQSSAVAEALKTSLIFIPVLCVAAGVLLAEVVGRVDRAGLAAWIPETYETSPQDGRTVLGAIATGTISVVTLVLTLTLVAIQLAAGQLSPRIIASFLGDRFQQAAVGVVLGTAAFSMVALRAIDVGAKESGAFQPDLTVLIAVVLTLVSLIILVVSVDRTASRLSVGALVTDLAQATGDVIDRVYGADSRHGIRGERDGAPSTESHPPASLDERRAAHSWEPQTSLSTDRGGWVQVIDEERFFEAIPEGASARLLRPVGSFVYPGMELVQLDVGDLGSSVAEELRAAIVVGDERTDQQDVDFGLTRLNDVALRALSPGVNDPNTAREVILRLGQVLLQALSYELPKPITSQNGRHLERVGASTHADLVRAAFEQIRLAAAGDRATLETLAVTLSSLEDEAKRRDLPGDLEEVANQHDLVKELLAEHAVGSNVERRNILR